MSLNRKSQIEQMDLMIRYLHVDQVREQYFDSQFLVDTVSKDLLECIRTGISKLNYRKLLHVSVDGPIVNWKLFTLLCEEREKVDANLPKLWKFGSCGLHIVHGAFFHGSPVY